MQVVYPYEFIDGQNINAARLDAMFQALTTALNGNLGKDNFRRTAGLSPSARVSQYSWVPFVFSQKQGSVLSAGTRVELGRISVPHRSIGFTPDNTQPAPGPSGAPLLVTGYTVQEDDNDQAYLLREPGYIHSIQACIRSQSAGAGNLAGTKVTLNWLPPLASAMQSQDLLFNVTIPLGNIATYTFGTPQPFVKLTADLTYVLAVGADVCVNISVIVWTKMPHLL